VANPFLRRVRAAVVLGLVGGTIGMALGAAGLRRPRPRLSLCDIDPFAGWKDYANYAFAPDGGFESGGSGWPSAAARALSEGTSCSTFTQLDKTSLWLPAGDQR